jgi:CheY-like chemotaxis protein
LRGDPIRLGQILNNLLSNAIKFTNDGSITLGIRPDDTRASSPTKRDLIIEVTDTGVGIEKSDQANLFKDFSQIPLETSENDPFLDLSGSRHGAGLGLAICRTLVTQMGGRISVMSSSGKGATFAIRLALEVVSDADPIEKPAELHPLVTADGKAPHALIAEDVPANQLVSRMLLESFGCHVEIANDGVDAVDACKKRTYDFVLMDVSMPRLDGIAATEQIRALQGSGIGELPIIGLTAFSVSSTGEDAGNAVIDFGVLMALTSGLNDGQLRKIVQQFIDDLDKYRREAIKEAKNGNITKLARACHAVKGLASSSGSQALANLASAIEDAAREGDSELAVAYTIDRLNRTTDESLKTLNEYLAKFQPLSNAS